MKKIALCLLLILSIFTLAACKNGQIEKEPTPPVIEEPLEPVEPVEPVDPEEPIDPVDPVDPVEPVEPGGDDKYTVNFYIENDLFYSTKVKPNELVNNMSAPIYEDIIFMQWELNNKAFNFTNEITSSIDLHAKYIKDFFGPSQPNEDNKKYVYYYVDGILFDKLEITNSKAIKLTAPIKENHNFLYWSNLKNEFNFDTLIDESISLYAKYIKTDTLPQLLNNQLKLYYITDTHGAVLENENEIGLAKISGFLNNERSNNQSESIFIAGGDIFQGQIISNHFKGESMVEALNHMQLDAFVLGNHEFDWGLDEILKYKDESYEGIKANFPILGANVLLKSTNERPKNVDPYVIVNKNGLKVGIIGVMGDGLESSISTYRVQDYYFADAYDAVLKYANLIMDEVDLIVVSAHSYDTTFNSRVSQINKVETIFSAHTHRLLLEEYQNVPSLQAGNNGIAVGEVSLLYNVSNNVFKVNNFYTYNHLKYTSDFSNIDWTVKNVIDKYYDEVKDKYEEVLLTSKSDYDQFDLSIYMAKLMRVSTNALVGVQNTGGTRSSFYQNQQLTGADVFKVYPFDNQIIYFKMSGADINKLKNSSLAISKDPNTYFLNTVDYLVATNDYVFYGYSEFRKYRDSGNYAYFGDMYEILANEMFLMKKNGLSMFDVNLDIQTPPLFHHNFN